MIEVKWKVWQRTIRFSASLIGKKGLKNGENCDKIRMMVMEYVRGERKENGSDYITKG